jgi:hypothetical protein
MKQTAIIVVGLVPMSGGMFGHIWHKYFTAAGRSRFTDFHRYLSEHWYYWTVFLVGVVLIWVGTRGHSATRSSERRVRDSASGPR